jgi:hypothetical protein
MEAFARTVENAKGLETSPSELIRRMAGQDHRGAGTAVGKALVANSRIPRELRPAAVQLIGDAVVRGFDELPELLNEAEDTPNPERTAQTSRRFGQALGLEVQKLFRSIENDPELVHQGLALEGQDPGLRFAPGHDRASAGFGGTTASAGGAAADRTANGRQAKSRGGFDGRS